MKKTIILRTPEYGKLLNQFRKIKQLLVDLEDFETNDIIKFDFSNMYFIHPTYILAIRSIISELIQKGKKVTYSGINHPSIKSYLETIYFKTAFNPLVRSNWEDQINYFKLRTYTPIIKFPASHEEYRTEIREQTLSCLINILKINCGLNNEILTGVSYLISEITDNIVEHSLSKYGWLSAQYYPTKKYIDICILDNGIGLLESYLMNGFNSINTYSKAIESALGGLSTKKNKERGYGVRTSNSISVNGLNGNFILLSGNRIYINNQHYYFGQYWEGTLVSMRIYNNIDGFSVYNYVEG